MTTEVIGNGTSLEDAANTIEQRLTSLGFELYDKTCWNPVSGNHSILIEDRKLPFISALGKGTSSSAARLDALSKIMARLSDNYFFKDFYLRQAMKALPFSHDADEKWFAFTGDAIPDGLLDEATLSHYDLDEELTASMLVDINSGNTEKGICSLPFKCIRSQKEVWFPVNIINNLYEFNGTATGQSLHEARVEALSGIFERHIKNTILTSGISLPRIPDEYLSGHSELNHVISTLEACGLVLYTLDASLGGKFPLVCMVVVNPKNQGCLASFGAHPKFELALERSINGLFAGRNLEAFETLPPLSFEFSEVAEQSNLEAHLLHSKGIVPWDLISEEADYEFTQWNIEGTPEDEFEHLCHLIHKVDMDIYIRDYTHLGIQSCRVIVPGMSEIYPVEKLVEANKNQGLSLRSMIVDLPNLNQEQAATLLLQMNNLALDPSTQVTDLIGDFIQAENWLRDLSVAELSCLLHLVLGDLRSAYEMCLQTLEIDMLSSKRHNLYLCLSNILRVKLDRSRVIREFSRIWSDLYGTECFEKCQKLSEGHSVFANCFYPENDSICHDLTEIYTQLQRLKI